MYKHTQRPGRCHLEPAGHPPVGGVLSVAHRPGHMQLILSNAAGVLCSKTSCRTCRALVAESCAPCAAAATPTALVLPPAAPTPPRAPPAWSPGPAAHVRALSAMRGVCVPHLRQAFSSLQKTSRLRAGVMFALCAEHSCTVWATRCPYEKSGLLPAMYNDEQNPYLDSGLVQHLSWAPLQQATCNMSAAAPCPRHARGHGVFFQRSDRSASC